MKRWALLRMLSGGRQQICCCLACRKASAALSHVRAACRLHQSKMLPADYTAVKNSYDHDWPLKQDDFFPYADCPTCYWTGTYLPTACIACAFCRPALWPAMLITEGRVACLLPAMLLSLCPCNVCLPDIPLDGVDQAPCCCSHSLQWCQEAMRGSAVCWLALAAGCLTSPPSHREVRTRQSKSSYVTLCVTLPLLCRLLHKPPNQQGLDPFQHQLSQRCPPAGEPDRAACQWA